ncbi:unnamed protein product, partial [Arabidopsis halleri]
TDRVYISCHVIFDENCFPFTERYRDLVTSNKTGILGAWQKADASLPLRALPTLPQHITNPHNDSQWLEYMVEYPQEDNGCAELSINNEQSPSSSPSTDHSTLINEEIGSPQLVQTEDSTTAAQSLHPITTRSKDGIRKPNLRYALVASKTIPSLPKTVAEALKHPGWRQAMLDELNSIYENQTWTLIPATSEMNILGCSNVVSWSAKQQPTVSRALASTASELTWTASVLRDLGIKQSQAAIIRCDNLSAVHLSANPVLNNHSKHFDVDYHYVRERVALGVLEIQHILAALQLAETITKSLSRWSFQQLRHKLNVRLPPTLSLRGNVSDKPQAQQNKAQVKSLPQHHNETNSQGLQKPSLQLHNETNEKQNQSKPAGSPTIVLSNRFNHILSEESG